MGKGKIRKDTVIRKLITSFPDAVVSVPEGDAYTVDFEETLYNLAERVLDTMSRDQIKNAIGDPFDNVEDLVHHMRCNLDGLREACEEFVNE